MTGFFIFKWTKSGSVVVGIYFARFKSAVLYSPLLLKSRRLHNVRSLAKDTSFIICSNTETFTDLWTAAAVMLNVNSHEEEDWKRAFSTEFGQKKNKLRWSAESVLEFIYLYSYSVNIS